MFGIAFLPVSIVFVARRCCVIIALPRS